MGSSLYIVLTFWYKRNSKITFLQIFIKSTGYIWHSQFLNPYLGHSLTTFQNTEFCLYERKICQMLRFYLHWWDIYCRNGHMQNLNFLQFRYFVIYFVIFVSMDWEFRLTKTWDINGHRISNTHLWSVISTPIWYAYMYYHDYYKNNSPKNPYKSTGYDTQSLHPYLWQI
jgi:hypothetical protein